MKRMYKGPKFTKDQLTFVAEASLSGCMDLIESVLPDNISWEEHQSNPEERGYHKGCVEAAGEALSIIAAQLIGDGVGCYDALAMAGNFDKAVDTLFKTAWEDQGVAVKTRLAAFDGPFKYADLYPGCYPDAHACAEVFAETIFEDQV